MVRAVADVSVSGVPTVCDLFEDYHGIDRPRPDPGYHGQPPNLEDLSLSGPSILPSALPQGAGPHPGWRFGGQLRLDGGLAENGIINTLLEIPTGLRFTEVTINSMRNRFLSAVRLVEACSRVPVKLSYTATLGSKSRFSRPSRF